MRPYQVLPLVLTAAAAAQGLVIFPGTTSYSSRGDIGTAAGELQQGFHASHWKGIGESGSRATLTGVTLATQDLNAATQETYDLVIRTGTDATGPATGIAGEACVVSRLMTPLGSAGSAAWSITTTFGTPCKVPSSQFFSVGVRLSANAGWARTDGQSVHMSDASVQQSGPHQGDHAWQMIGSGSAIHFGTRRSIRIKALTNCPILQNGVFATGTSTYSRGMGGMFPPVGTHGWSTHVDGGLPFANGFTAVFMSPATIDGGFALPGFRGLVWVGAPMFPLATAGLSGLGTADVKLLDPLRAFAVTVYLQAVLVDRFLGSTTLTNSNATTFR